MIVCVSAGRDAPSEVRARLAPASDSIPSLLRSRPAGIDELVALSTCHRVELYAATDPTFGDDAIEASIRLLPSLRDGDRDELRVLRGRDAIAHLFRVTCGLESLVVGEEQIQGQVRRALYAARTADAAGPLLTTIFSRALRLGRRARRETPLGSIGESLGTACARLLDDRFAPLAGRRVLIVGAGEAAADAAVALAARGAVLTIMSRSASHADGLAHRLSAATAPFSSLTSAVADADAVVVAVAGGPVITSTVLAGSMATLIDLSMPPGIDPSLRPITVEQLPAPEGPDVDRGIEAAASLIDEELGSYLRWADARDGTGSAIRALRALSDRVITEEISRIALDEADAERLRTLAQRVANALLHGPTRMLRDGDVETAAWLGSLFDLDQLRDEVPSSVDER